MSLQATVWALKHAPVRDPLAHLVLIGLADHAGDDGRNARPSRTTLARYARCSTRSVQNKLQDLEADGLIVRGDQRQTEHLRGDRRPVVYDLDFSVTIETGVKQVPVVTSDAPDTPDEVQEVHPDDVQEIHPVDPRGEHDDNHGVNVSAHRTVLNEPLYSSSTHLSNARTIPPVGTAHPPSVTAPPPAHPEGNVWRPSANAMATAKAGAPDVNLETVIAKFRVWCATKKRQPESSNWVQWCLRDQESIEKEKALERQREQKPKRWWDVAD